MDIKNITTGLVAKIKGFLKETNSEMKKVVWPSRQYVVAATIIILIIVVLMAVFVMFVDLVFSRLMDHLIKAF